ncbi:hypothetical protein EGW08_015341 [Elysia chlorotica]|uniref:C2 domain-containing protein n=1 Tax=Elysia chlorotica TaxID=188477 RepID=A0A433T625_ELYCH|nr:hypothetical protein EGW08_015341 [Elysia chlorotica]
MSVWSPTHVQFTVLRARNLVAKGKGGNNDVFATIQLGRDKFQTSTIKNALNPEWFEECDLSIPHMHTMVEVTLYHRGLLSDDFLGYAAVPVWEHKVADVPQSSWVSLQGKPSAKSSEGKYRGELEVKLAFLCHSRPDGGQGGLKKRTSSIRNLASVFGDKFKFTRSRSLRENRRDPEGGKMDRLPGQSGLAPLEGGEENLSRSYSLSAAYIKSMSLERGPRVFSSSSHTNGSVSNITGSNSTNTITTTNSSTNRDSNNSTEHHVTSTLDRTSVNGSLDWTDKSPLHHYSGSAYNLPGERSCASELLPTLGPRAPTGPGLLPARCARSQSQDDSALAGLLRDPSGGQGRPARGHRGRTMSDIFVGSSSQSVGITNSSSGGGTQDTSASLPGFALPPPPPPSLPGQAWRDQFYASVGGGGGAGIYESIKERTEPENSLSSSSSSSSDGESVPVPKAKRNKRAQKKPIMGKGDLLQQHHYHQQQIQQLYRQPHRQAVGSNLDPPVTRRAASPTKPPTTSANSYSSVLQHPIPPPPLPFFRHAPRPNSYPNSSGLFPTSPSLDSSHPSCEKTASVRDSGILDDRSSSQGNSLEGSGLTTPDCVSITGVPTSTTATKHSAGGASSSTPRDNKSWVPSPAVSSGAHTAKAAGGGILFHLDQELSLKRGVVPGTHGTEAGPPEGVPSFPGYWHRRENSQGELVIRKRSRGERDRLRQARQAQGNRRYTVQGMESCPLGGYSDSQSEASASPRQEVPDSLMTVYSNMNKEELLRVVIQAKAQMIRKDQYIRDLETYIDDLLVRVMETTPRLLSKPNMLRL